MTWHRNEEPGGGTKTYIKRSYCGRLSSRSSLAKDGQSGKVDEGIWENLRISDVESPNSQTSCLLLLPDSALFAFILFMYKKFSIICLFSLSSSSAKTRPTSRMLSSSSQEFSEGFSYPPCDKSVILGLACALAAKWLHGHALGCVLLASLLHCWVG